MRLKLRNFVFAGLAVPLTWAFPAVGGEPPPGWHQDIPTGPVTVDGTQVSGRIDAVSLADVRQAITAFWQVGLDHVTLTVVGKDEIHGYASNQDLGWYLAKRATFVWPDRSEHPGWNVGDFGLPDKAKALDCIKYAQKVYVFPVATPDDPHRDDAHMRLLEGEASSQLVDVLGSGDAWERALDSMRSPPSPPDVGFVFKHGNDELVLFPWGWLKVSGTFDGEHLGGLLTGEAVQKLKAWKAKYAQPELAVHE